MAVAMGLLIVYNRPLFRVKQIESVIDPDRETSDKLLRYPRRFGVYALSRRDGDKGLIRTAAASSIGGIMLLGRSGSSSISNRDVMSEVPSEVPSCNRRPDDSSSPPEAARINFQSPSRRKQPRRLAGKARSTNV